MSTAEKLEITAVDVRHFKRLPRTVRRFDSGTRRHRNYRGTMTDLNLITIDCETTPRTVQIAIASPDAVAHHVIATADEDCARRLRDALTAWLDAPRLAARKTPTVVAEFGGVALLKTSAGEWGIVFPDEFDGERDVDWCADEAEARGEFRAATGASRCESCGTYRDDHDCDEEGICTCADETACSAACAANEAK
jgi:hypothetical protein